MKITHYSYGRTNTEMYSKYSRYDTYTAVLEVEVNGKTLCCCAQDSISIPEHYLRRKLQQQILNEIGQELFGS